MVAKEMAEKIVSKPHHINVLNVRGKLMMKAIRSIAVTTIAGVPSTTACRAIR